ncbi:MAG: adenylate/guanylate cyclase domain-containing protein [Flavobacteriales bacterium]
MKHAKFIPLASGLALASLIGCTEPEHNAPAEQGRRSTAADSIALVKFWEDSLKPAIEQDDVPTLKRITADMLHSPYARNKLPVLMSTLEWRYYSMGGSGAKEPFAVEVDSMLSDARVREDTTMLFALLNIRASMTMNSEHDLAKALVFREQALRLDPRQVLIEQVPAVYMDLAEAYDNVKQWDRSLVYSARMIRYGMRTGDTAAACWGHVYMAAEFQQLGHVDSIDRHVQAALRLIPHFGKDYVPSTAYALLAGIERQRGRNDRCGPLLDSMTAVLGTRPSSQRLEDCPLCMMELAWHELHNGRSEQAEDWAKAMAKAGDFQRSKIAQQCYHQVMDSIAIALGDYRSAYDHRAQYIAIRDSMNLTSAATNLQRIENNYKEDAANALRRLEDEAAVNLLQKERTRRNILFAAGLVAMVFGAISYRQRRRTQKALHRSDELLLNILPEEVAEELKAKGHADAKHFDSVTILFTDFKGFTEASEKLTPQELVEELNTCFKAFDHIITARGIEKIKTIGDAYMCAGGLPDPKTSSPAAVVHAALEMQAFMTSRKKERDALGLPAFEMRVGIHTGPVVAGIVGVKKFQYDIWGDTVNTASRMESSGEVGQVNISEATYALVTASQSLAVTGAFTFTPRGKVQAKGKGEMEMYFVLGSPIVVL